MSTIRIPPVLRSAAGNQKQVSARGTTLRATLDDLFEHYPGLRTQVLTPEGDLTRFVNVFVDEQDVRYQQGLDTSVTPDSTIILLPAMAGGELGWPIRSATPRLKAGACFGESRC